MQWHGDSKVAAVVNTMDEWVDAQKLLTPLENIVVEAEVDTGYARVVEHTEGSPDLSGRLSPSQARGAARERYPGAPA